MKSRMADLKAREDGTNKRRGGSARDPPPSSKPEDVELEEEEEEEEQPKSRRAANTRAAGKASAAAPAKKKPTPKGRGGGADEDGDEEAGQEMDDMSSAAGTASTRAARSDYLGKVEQVKGLLAAVDENMAEMERLHREKVNSTTHLKLKKLNDELEGYLKDTNENIRKAQELLKAMDAENQKFQGGSGEKRMRESQFQALARSLADKSRQVQESEGEALMRYRTRLKGEIQIADPDASEERIEEYLSAGESRIFADMLFHNQASAHTIKTTYEMAMEKYRDLLQLEASMEELHELMVDFSNMVFMQGALVDQISANVEKADNYVAKGTQELYAARKHQKAARKLMCCGCTML